MSDKNDTDHVLPGPDSLRVQLSELNIRGRWYSSQLWQLPFAYFGVSGLVVGQALTRNTTYLPVILIAVAIFGFFVIWHMIGILDGQKRSVDNIQSIEKSLHLPVTALWKLYYVLPLIIAVLFGVLAYLGFGLFLIRCLGCECIK